jgi:hypothetical protein
MSEKKKIYKCEQCGEPCVIHIFNNGLDIDMPELCPVEKSCSPRWMEISDFYHNPPHETVEAMEQFIRDFSVWWWEREEAKDYGITLDGLKTKSSEIINILNDHHGKPPKEKS